VAPDGSTVATGGTDGALRLWDARTGQPLRTVSTFPFGVASVAFSPDGRLIAAGRSWSAVVFDLASGRELRKVEHMGGLGPVTFAPDGRALASGSGSGQVLITDLSSGARAAFGQRYPARGLSFSPDGRTLASLGDAG